MTSVLGILTAFVPSTQEVDDAGEKATLSQVVKTVLILRGVELRTSRMPRIRRRPTSVFHSLTKPNPIMVAPQQSVIVASHMRGPKNRTRIVVGGWAMT